jgi:hypothetical protein
MSQVTSVADAVSAPVAGSDPTPRSASLRSVNTPAPRASQRPRAPTAGRFRAHRPERRAIDRKACPPPRAGERAAHAPQRPCKRFWGTFTPSPHSRRGTAPKGAQNGLERLRGIPAPARGGPSRPHPHLRSGEGRAAAPRKCDDTHGKKGPRRFASALGMGFNEPITAEGAKLPDPVAAASGGLPGRPEELTQGDEIPGKPGGFASTRWPGRTEMLWSISQRDPRQADHRYTARRARITGSANRL